VRVKIEIDERLVRQAMRATEAETNEAVVEDALRLLIQTKRPLRHPAPCEAKSFGRATKRTPTRPPPIYAQLTARDSETESPKPIDRSMSEAVCWIRSSDSVSALLSP